MCECVSFVLASGVLFLPLGTDGFKVIVFKLVLLFFFPLPLVQQYHTHTRTVTPYSIVRVHCHVAKGVGVGWRMRYEVHFVKNSLTVEIMHPTYPRSFKFVALTHAVFTISSCTEFLKGFESFWLFQS